MALVYHDVELYINFRKFNELWVSNIKGIKPTPIPRFEARILIDYIYLDIEERRNFYLESQIYLIEQLQCTECSLRDSSSTIDIYFNHPVKELVWVLQRNDVIEEPDGLWDNSKYPKGNDWFNFSTFQNRNTIIKEDTFDTGKLQLNGIDRFRERKASYFRLYQPYYYHTRIPINNYIYVYSFGLRPETIQPTGTQNFSRVDNVRLLLNMKSRRSYNDYTVKIYGINFNILVISAGLAGILYHN
jgi:hypothetical protein